MGAGGLMTSMQMRLTCNVSLSALCIGGEEGMLMILMLVCMMLIAFAEDNNGDDDAYGDNHDNDNVAPGCPCCCSLQPCKDPRVF